MKIGDLVRRSSPRTLARDGVGLVQKIVGGNDRFPTRKVYHIRWPDGGLSNHFDNEIILVSRI